MPARVRLARYEVYEDKAGEYRFRLVGGNGEIVAVSEGYSTRADAERGVSTMKENAKEAELEEPE